MGLVWNGYGAWGVLAMLASLAMAALILRQRADRRQNRYLALALSMDALSMGLGLGVLYFVDDYWWAYNVQVWQVVFGLAVAPAYLLFLSTLDVPLTRPLRPRAVRWTFTASMAALPFLVLSNPTLYIVDMTRVPYAPFDAVAGPGFALSLLLIAFTSIYGLAVALWYAFRLKGSPHARAYLAAFGTRDVILAGTILLGGMLGGIYERVRLEGGAPINAVLAPLAILLTAILLGYGILNTQLFDIDLRLKWTLRRSSLVALFAAAFFLVSETIETLLPVQGAVPGVVAAGAVALALQPLRGLADGLADRLMPNVRDTEEYTLARKREVYRSALEAARADGEITSKEHAVLEKLRESLGLRPEDVHTPLPVASTPEPMA